MSWWRNVSAFKVPIVLAVTLAVTACAQTTDTVVTDTSCLAFEPIRWSSEDSDKTIRQVKAHNAAWDRLCGDDE